MFSIYADDIKSTYRAQVIGGNFFALQHGSDLVACALLDVRVKTQIVHQKAQGSRGCIESSNEDHQDIGH